MRYLSKMLLFTNRYVLQILSMATFLHICQARSLANESTSANPTDSTLWQPEQGTREEWMACHGMPKDVCESISLKKQELQTELAKKFGLDDSSIASYPQDSTTTDSDAGQCIMFTEEQLDMMITEAKKKEKTTSTNRKKRALVDFKNVTYASMWSMPIPYMFDGTHDEDQKATIRSAFQHWADNTCVRFLELPTNAVFNSNYIMITKVETDGCYSYLGRTSSIPQQMNLESDCVTLGIVLHEIGHALGLVHEQSRPDRNDYVRVLWNNIRPSKWSQYEERPNTDAFGLPYNYGSVMHYPSRSGFGLSSEVDTILALQPLYQMNMGQEVDLSLYDKKIINLGYCKGVCATPLTQPCQRGGYQNPNNCSNCICPDGFSGQYCDEIAQPKNANCGGILNIESGTQQVIKSPGYDSTGYSQHQECTWWIKAPANYTLELEFIGNFSIACSFRSDCVFHWVEIKYRKDLGLEGPRFCCYSRPTAIVISESNEMMVIFRSNYSLGAYRPRGFQAIVKSRATPVTNSSNPISTAATTSHASTPLSTKSILSSATTGSSTTSASTRSVSTVSSSNTTESSGSTETTPNTTTATTTSATTSVRAISSRSSLTSIPVAGASGFLLLSLLLQLPYLPF